MPDKLILRTTALLLHGLFNFILLTWVMKFDLTGSWLLFIGFIILALAMLSLLVMHLVSYYFYLKTYSK